MHTSFLKRSLIASLLLHTLAIGVMGVVLYFSLASIEITEGPAVGIGMNWEVNAPVSSNIQPRAQRKRNTTPSAANKLSGEQAPTASDLKTTAAGAGSAAGNGPPTSEIQKYLFEVRQRLSNALELKVSSHTPVSSVVLKVSLSPMAQVLSQEIEKSSGYSEIDETVLHAFQSILPLPSFPAAWNSARMNTLTVRFPVEVRPRKSP